MLRLLVCGTYLTGDNDGGAWLSAQQEMINTPPFGQGGVPGRFVTVATQCSSHVSMKYELPMMVPALQLVLLKCFLTPSGQHGSAWRVRIVTPTNYGRYL